jgi:hypothetical protein
MVCTTDGMGCAARRGGASSRDLQGDDIAYAGKTETMLSAELRSLVRRHSLTKKIDSKRNLDLERYQLCNLEQRFGPLQVLAEFYWPCPAGQSDFAAALRVSRSRMRYQSASHYN